MKRFILAALIMVLLLPIADAKTQKEEYKNDALYSQEYFDYLIECASIEANEQKAKKTQKAKQAEKELSLENILEEEDIKIENTAPFKLAIEENVNVGRFGQTFKVIDTKTVIPVGGDFSFYQNTKKSRNKYNSTDYKVLAGAEAGFGKYVSVASGLETNFRGLDQNPQSRKLYLTPTLNITDRVAIKLHNKVNIQSHIQDCDLELSISPLKSKALDFGVYAATSKTPSGNHSESINFSTTFYFF